MRLLPADVAKIPAAAALRASDGTIVAHTPEWRGPGPGTLSYRMGTATVAIASDRMNPDADYVIGELLNTLRRGGDRIDARGRRRAQMLAASLEVAAGRPVTSTGTLADVLEATRIGVSARCDAHVDMEGEWDSTQVRGSDALAVALVQLVKNLEDHDHATQVHLAVSFGPTFTLRCLIVQSPRERPQVTTSRSAVERERWGAAYCRHIADALGGVISQPLTPTAATREITLALGTSRLALPLAVFKEATVSACTEAWTEETGSREAQPAPDRLLPVLQAARDLPGQIVSAYPWRARSTGSEIWAMEVINDEEDIIREVVNGLYHERALWAGVDPEATEVFALSSILATQIGGSWRPNSPITFGEQFPRACEALGLGVAPYDEDALSFPDARIAAYLLRTLGGELVAIGTSIALRTANRDHPLARMLQVDADGVVALTR